MNRRTVYVLIFGLLALIATFIGCLLCGSVDIPASQVIDTLFGGNCDTPSRTYIVLETRIPAACTAVLCGIALSVAGLLMQTLFDNPLAGPSILGISTGSSLGVALILLATGTVAGIGGQLSVLGGALTGALAVMLILLAMSSIIRSSAMLLIVGILLGYVASSAISLLNFFASREGVHSFVIWGLGSFSGVTRASLLPFAISTAVLTGAAGLYSKTLNALLLGQRYAASAGVNLKAVRRGLLFVSGSLTAVATAWCGPIGFIGLVVPHIARLLTRSSNHKHLLPATAILGGAIGALTQWLCVLPGQHGVLPVNAITPIIGIPVIIYIIIRRRSISYFN